MGLYRRNGGKVWLFSIMHNGRRVQHSTKTENKKLAERLYAEALLKVQDGTWFEVKDELIQAVPDHTFEELVDRYITDHAIPTKMASSVSRDRYSFKQMKRVFGGLNLKQITPSRIADYKSLRRREDAKPATLAKELQVLRNSLNIAMREWEWLETTPFTKVRIEIPKNQKERWLTLDEEALLLGECPDWLREIVTFAIYTGMRRNEILSLRWPQVDMDREMVTLLVTKNKEKRGIPLSEKIVALLKAKMETRKNSGYVFPSETGTMIEGHNVGRSFRKAREKAGLPDVRFHDLRHTAGSRMVQAGVDIYTVSLILGHKTLAMTKRYAHHNVESLRHGVNALVSGHV